MLAGVSKTTAPNQKLAWILIAVLFALSVLVQAISSVNQDVSWLLYMASQTLEGARLYTDLVELNPPLIIWLMTPSVWLSNILGLSLAAGFKAYVLCLSAGSLLLCRAYLQRLNFPHWPFLLVGITYILTLLPASHFGQREHLMLILTLPYLFLIALRQKQMVVPFSLVVITGFLAALGFCIKPYFLIVPVLLELYLFWTIGVQKTFKRIEPYIIGLGTSMYLLAIILITPEYLSRIVPYTMEVYGAGHETPISKTLNLLTWPVFLLLIGLFWTKSRHHKIAQTLFPVFLIAAIGMMCTALIQSKGWWSHIIPVQSLVLIGVFSLLVKFWRKQDENTALRIVQTVILIGLVGSTIPPIYTSINSVNIKNSQKLEQRVADFPETTSLWIMSASLSHGFPLVTETNLTWASRFGSLWMVPGVQQRRQALKDSNPLLDEIEHYYRQSVADDLKTHRPELIFVDTQKHRRYFQDMEYDFIQDFSHNDDFRRVWAGYDKVGEFESFFDIYKLKSN